MENKMVTILCSGVALGVYNPALSVRYELLKFDISSEVVVLESLYKEDKRNKINESKKVFHNNFKIARKAHQMARDITPNLNSALMKEIFNKWKLEKRVNFIVFSGFWIPVLTDYMNFMAPVEICADLVIVDSVSSPSWNSYKGSLPESFTVKKLFDYKTGNIIQKLFSLDMDLFDYNTRDTSLVIHGGGWGMGTFQNYIPKLNKMGIKLNVIIYFKNENFKKYYLNRYFMIDPSWRPWHKDNNGNVTFPPLGEVTENEEKFVMGNKYNELVYIILNSKGIISKPGGATLVESFASATPVIFLDPLGEHEKKNAALWVSLGFGIYYEDWEKENFSFDLLEEIHKNILSETYKKEKYVDSYIDFLKV